MNIPEAYNRIVAVNVDPQRDFCRGGSLAVPGGDEVIGPLNDVNRWARSNGGTVAFTGDDHPEVTTHFGNAPDFATTWPPHCIHGTPGAEFHPGLQFGRSDLVFRKGQGSDEDGYSGF